MDQYAEEPMEIFTPPPIVGYWTMGPSGHCQFSIPDRPSWRTRWFADLHWHDMEEG